MQRHLLRSLSRPAKPSPADPANLGTGTNGWGLLGAGTDYNYSMTTGEVNNNGWQFTGVSSQATGGIRPGNQSQSLNDAFINSLRVQASGESMMAQLPSGVATWSYGEVYHGGNPLCWMRNRSAFVALSEWRSARLRLLASAGVLGMGDISQDNFRNKYPFHHK